MNKKEKELHEIAANYILNKDITKRITGKSFKVNSYVKLLEVSKKLYNMLKEEGNLEEIVKLLDEKRNLVIEFKKQTGIDWRL